MDFEWTKELMKTKLFKICIKMKIDLITAISHIHLSAFPYELKKIFFCQSCSRFLADEVTGICYTLPGKRNPTMNIKDR